MPDVKVNITGENKDALNSLKEVETEGRGLGGKIGDGLKAGLEAAAKAGAAAMAATAAAIAAVGTAAFNAYGEFEQLRDGAELMFGEGFEFIMGRAQNAFQNVQMSANDYLAKANFYATGLTQALDGDAEAAARLTDRIITAQADILAATGLSSDSISNAFEGVMRGNYTMLDNLGLGIKGTKEGLQEVIDKMNEVNGTEYDINNLADAQNAILDYVEYVGMAGYAQEEAMGTIQGSLAATKAAWDNLLVGLADPDMDASGIQDLVKDLMKSFEAFTLNATPIIQSLADSFAQALPIIVPDLINLAMGIIGTLGETLVTLMPTLTESFQQVIQMLVDALPTMLPLLLEGAMMFFLGMIDALAEATPQILEALSIALITLIQMLPELIPRLLTAALTFFTAIVTAIFTKGPEILAALGQAIADLFQKVVESGPEMLTKFGELMGKAREGISQKAEEIWNALKQAVNDALDKVRNIDFLQVGMDIINGIKEGVLSVAGNLATAAKNAVGDALGAAKKRLDIASPSKVFRDEVGKMMIEGAIVGIEDETGLLDAAVDKAFDFNLQPSVLGAGTFSDAMARTLAFAKPIQNVTNNVYEREDAYVASTIFTRALMQGV